jgi:hypothetical protein
MEVCLHLDVSSSKVFDWELLKEAANFFHINSILSHV